MGVYIKGFPLPNNCGACPLRLAWCRERIYMVNRPERCPLVPVPDHGRLGDLDELYAHLNEWYLTHRGGMSPTEALYIRAMLDGIKAAPTVIPVDKEGNSDVE